MIGQYERRLFCLIEKWGGKVVCFETHKEYWHKLADIKFDEAPFTGNDIGIDFNTKTIYYSKEYQPDWTEIIHEMGHVFGSKYSPKSSKCKEQHFFGWEYLLAKKIRAPIKPWYASNIAYGINPECKCHKHKRAINSCVSPEFGDFDRKCQLTIINHWIEFGKKYGNVSSDRKPIPVR